MENPMRRRLWLGMGCGIVVVALLIPLVTTRRTESSTTYFCELCGMRLWKTSDDVVGTNKERSNERSLKETDLSRWFQVHFGPTCQHKWHFNHLSSRTYRSFAGRRLWVIGGEAGSYATPDIIDLTDEKREKLELLFRKNPESCRRYIHDRLQRKEETGESNEGQVSTPTLQPIKGSGDSVTK